MPPKRRRTDTDEGDKATGTKRRTQQLLEHQEEEPPKKKLRQTRKDETGDELAPQPKAKPQRASKYTKPALPRDVSIASDPVFKNTQLDVGSAQLKICFWNLNGLRAVLKNGNILQNFITTESPDIILFNETRLQLNLCDEFKDCIPGYEAFFCCSKKKGYAGVATFIKTEVNARAISTGLNDDALDEEGRVQTVEVLAPGFPKFYIVNTYVMNAGQKLVRLDYKIDSFNPALYNYLNSLREKSPVLWCGDLNVAHQEIDIWNSKANQKSAGHTPQERSSFGDFLLKSHWVDVFRHHYPDRRQYTYWSGRFPSNYVDNKGWRLDYFVATKEFLPFCKDVITLQSIRGSDHCPIVLACAAPANGSGAVKNGEAIKETAVADAG